MTVLYIFVGERTSEPCSIQNFCAIITNFYLKDLYNGEKTTKANLPICNKCQDGNNDFISPCISRGIVGCVYFYILVREKAGFVS